MKNLSFSLLGLLFATSLLLVSCSDDDDSDNYADMAVDLGLPSGIKWASCNVGASSPEEYGGYYAWGEIEEKEDYSWATYKWCKNGSSSIITKYKSFGTVLSLEDDVANVKLSGSWRMPTKAELDELRENCTWTWTSVNGIKGRKVTGPNGNSIFLPAAGHRGWQEVYDRGESGHYWSSSLSNSDNSDASYLGFDGGRKWGDVRNSRFRGYSVRPVCE